MRAEVFVVVKIWFVVIRIMELCILYARDRQPFVGDGQLGDAYNVQRGPIRLPKNNTN